MALLLNDGTGQQNLIIKPIFHITRKIWNQLQQAWEIVSSIDFKTEVRHILQRLMKRERERERERERKGGTRKQNRFGEHFN